MNFDVGLAKSGPICCGSGVMLLVNVSRVRLTWPCSVRAGAPRNSVTLDKVVLWPTLKELLPKAVC